MGVRRNDIRTSVEARSKTREGVEAVRTLQKTCFLIAMFVLTVQALRLLYIKCFEKHTSVLDKYEESSVDDKIKEAQSLDDLLKKHDRARDRYRELDRQRKGMSEDERQEFTDAHSEELLEQTRFRHAIVDWENKSREITELRVFWGLGLILVLVGAALYWRGFRWLGMALIVPGFSEMIWWTSPSFTVVGALREFDRLMNNKILFTFAALALLIVAWVLSARLQLRDDAGDI